MRKTKRLVASWRQFEKLVARIEEALAPAGAVVVSPDEVHDFVANKMREVDASIRYRVGTVEILIILECRERKRIQDTLWIEQLATKQQHVRAAKCIAVSSSGFSKSAAAKAATLGIDLRRVDRLPDEEIKKWTNVPLRTWFYKYKLFAVDLTFDDPNALQNNFGLDQAINAELAAHYYLEDEILINKSSGEKISLHQYIRQVFDRAYAEMSDEKREVLRLNTPYIMSWAGDPGYCVECSRGNIDVLGVAFKIAFTSFIDYSLRKTAEFTYEDGNRTLAEGIEFEGKELWQGKTVRVALHKDSVTGATSGSVWPSKGQPRRFRW